MLEAGDGRLEIRKELLFGSMCGATDGSSNNGFDADRSGIKETSKTLHDKLEVLVNNIVKNLKDSIQCSACAFLSFGVVDKGHDSLIDKQGMVRI